MKTEITIKDIAGYATERTVWQMLYSLSGESEHGLMKHTTHDSITVEGHVFRQNSKGQTSEPSVFAAPETFNNKTEVYADATDVWSIGAMAFYAITGVDVFEGKGGKTQTEATIVPRISLSRVSYQLSQLIHQCLSFSPAERPSKATIKKEALAFLSEPSVPHKKLTNQSGKGYATSLIKFWPEEMTAVFFICILMLFPSGIYGQNSKFGIPDEMANLVFQCVDLRTPSHAAKVNKALQRDLQWTMMDELPPSKNECSMSEKVNTFGLNDMMPQILMKRRGVVNSGGKMRDGRDKRYKFSLIEITVKKNSEVSYQIDGRQGQQLFAIIPFEKNANYSASVELKGKKSKDTFLSENVNYIRIGQKVSENQPLTLKIKNSSGKNAAFVIINYNSRKHE